MQDRNTILTMIVIACFGFLLRAQAVVPAPDGGYPGGNTAEGQNALLSLTTGVHNTAVGYLSLKSDITGGYNTAVGSGTLLRSTADGNTATGTFALLSNTSGGLNTANGALALFNNTTGERNNAVGSNALRDNMSGSFNNAVGSSALLDNTSGSYNNAFGNQALLNCTGSQNTAIGDGAGYGLTTGSGNVCIGAVVFGAAGESNTTRVRNVHATVQPVVGTDPDYVTVNSGGRLGRGNISSRRYKHDIQPMDKASEALYVLKPVSFRYNKEYDATQTIAFGLIAEDVAEVNADLVGRNSKGEPESVRYEQVNAMLLNEFLKEHRTVQELRNEIAALTATVKEQAAQIQRVSAHVEMSKSAAKVVLNNP